MARERRDYTTGGRRKRRKAWLIFQRDDFRCVYCGKSSVEDKVKLEAEHVVPRSMGGEDVAGNLVTSCRECNRSKFDQELEPEQVDRLLAVAHERNRKRRVSDKQPVSLGRTPQDKVKSQDSDAPETLSEATEASSSSTGVSDPSETSSDACVASEDVVPE